MNRDTFICATLLKNLSSLALSTGWGTHSLSRQPVPVLHHLTAKNVFLIFNLNLLSFTTNPIALVLSLHPLAKRPLPALSCWFFSGAWLIFFPLAGMRLCFGFMLNTTLMCLLLLRTQAFSAFCTATLGRYLGAHGKLGGDTAGTGNSN